MLYAEEWLVVGGGGVIFVTTHTPTHTCTEADRHHESRCSL